MKISNIISKRLNRYSERRPNVDLNTLSKEELEEEMNDRIIGAEFALRIMDMPKKEALTLLDKLEEQDDFIASLERAEKDPSPIMNEYKKYLQNDIDTGWAYPDNDDE